MASFGSSSKGKEYARSMRKFAKAAMAELLQTRRPRRVLVLTGNLDSLPDLPGDSFVKTVVIEVGRITEMSSVAGRIDALPLQSGVFDVVVAHEFLSGSDGPVLCEIERVTMGGGHLLVLGCGCWSLRAFRSPEAANIRPLRLCGLLRRHSYVIEDCAGFGVAGLRVGLTATWTRPVIGISDQVRIRARYRETHPIIRPVRFKRPRAVGARTVSADRFNRKAVS